MPDESQARSRCSSRGGKHSAINAACCPYAISWGMNDRMIAKKITAIPAVIFFAIILSFIPHDMAYGQQAALIAECFPPRLLQRLLAWLSSGIDHRGRAG